MSDSNGKNDPPKGNDAMDKSSFASILAGVQRMRDEYEPKSSNQQETASTSTAPQRPTPPARPAPARPRIERPVVVPRTRVERTGVSRSATPSGTSPSPTPDNASTRNIRQNQQVQSHSAIQVANSQKGNPLLSQSLMKTQSWQYNGLILSDYYINPLIQILFLSLKYHKLHPEYIWTRLKRLNKGSTVVGDVSKNDRALRILLVVVDIDSHQESLRKLADICIKHDLSLVLAWSFEEAGNYVAFCKQLELSTSKVNSTIKGVKKDDYHSCLVDTLTSIKSVNKTDVVNLLANCKSFKNIVIQNSQGNGKQMGNIQGLGTKKLNNMKSVFSEPFIYNKDYNQIS